MTGGSVNLVLLLTRACINLTKLVSCPISIADSGLPLVWFLGSEYGEVYYGC